MHKMVSYAFTPVFLIYGDMESDGVPVIHMSVIIHNTYPYCTDHFPFTVK